MESIFFYPRLTDELLREAGCLVSEYSFSYYLPSEGAKSLTLKKGRIGSLVDPTEMWRLRDDGVILRKTLTIEYPERLKGPDGIVPQAACLLPCILWASHKMSTAGVILPTSIAESPAMTCFFEHKFEPGSLIGDIELDLVLYLADKAECLAPGEEHLMNNPGVILGSVEDILLVDFDGNITDFPMEDVEDPGGPLWRVRFEAWEDPREDAFSTENFTLLINQAHPGYREIAPGGKVNMHLLQEILSEALFLLFEKVRDFDDESAWGDTMSGTDLDPGSICAVLYWFSQKGEEAFDWSTPEGRMLSIKRIVGQSYAANEEGE